MTTLEIFERISLKTPMEQRRFFNFFNDTADELETLYGFIPEVVFEDVSKRVKIKSLSDENNILPLYHEAVIDNIMFLSGQEEVYKSEFIRKSNLAYFRYWNDYAKHRRAKRMRW